MMAIDLVTGGSCEVDVLKEAYRAADLENLGRRHARDEFRLEDLAARLDGAEWFEDEAFTAYGLTEGEVSDLRAWAREWSDDIADRTSEQVTKMSFLESGSRQRCPAQWLLAEPPPGRRDALAGSALRVPLVINIELCGVQVIRSSAHRS
jgi:hypothetical protein